MIERTTDPELVNSIMRDAYGSEAVDVSASVAWPGNYVLASENGVVIFKPKGERQYRCSMGIRQAAQGSGEGSALLVEAIAWMFANTDAQSIHGLIGSDNAAIRAVCEKVPGATFSGPVYGSRLIARCERPSEEPDV